MKRPRIYTPETRLAKLVEKAGGRTREVAVALATAQVENLREASVSGIAEAIAELEAAFRQPSRGEDAHRRVLALIDRIVTLASHFGFGQLREVCNEFAALLLNANADAAVDADVAAVFFQAMRLFSPNASPLSDADALKVMDEIFRIRVYLASEARLPY